jgi:hypothetical protein
MAPFFRKELITSSNDAGGNTQLICQMNHFTAGADLADGIVIFGGDKILRRKIIGPFSKRWGNVLFLRES